MAAKAAMPVQSNSRQLVTVAGFHIRSGIIGVAGSGHIGHRERERWISCLSVSPDHHDPAGISHS